MTQQTLNFEGEIMQHVHQWTDQGLGEGPFRLVDVISFPSKSILEANPMAYNSQVAELHRQAAGYGLDGLCCCTLHACHPQWLISCMMHKVFPMQENGTSETKAKVAN